MRTLLGSKLQSRQSPQQGCDQAIRDGWEMAEKEGKAAFETIELLHAADTNVSQTAAMHLQARGRVNLEKRDLIDANLRAAGFTIAQYLHQTARGQIDLIQGLALLAVSAALGLFLLLAFGPVLLSILMALVILGSAASIEEFFHAHEDKAAMREGIFLVSSALALGAQFWFGVARGMLMSTLADTGPVSHMLHVAGPLVQHAIGILVIVTEILCGWKLYRARVALLAPTTRAFSERERLNGELLNLGRELEVTRSIPEIHKYHRTVGARQQIAWSKRAEEHARATHLKRAAKGAIIALLLLIALFFLAGRMFGASPVGLNEIALIDVSKSETPEDLRASTEAVTALIARLHAGDRLVVVPITDRFSNNVLLDETMPNASGYFGLNEGAARESIAAKWTTVSKSVKPTYARTDILGALTAISYLGTFALPGARIFIFSDMQQCTPEFDFEHAKDISVSSTIVRLKRANLIPSLRGTFVYALGVDPVGKSAQSYAELRAFWIAYFHEAGAELKLFSIEHRIPEH
jgi:hypothetical protein